MTLSWALYNALKNWTLYNLSEQDVKLLLLTFSENELKLAKLCKSGDSNWNNVLFPEFAHLLKKENGDRYQASDVFPLLLEQNDAKTDTGFFGMKGGKVVHPRLYNRIEKTVSCSIHLNDKNFATETVDLSEGGLYFKDVIPDWIAGYFIVEVDSKFRLMCSLVEDQKEKSRVQIVSEENDPHYVSYREWLAAVSSPAS